MLVNGWRRAALALLAGLAGAGIGYAETHDTGALWRSAADVRSELLAMLAAAAQDDAQTAREHARGAADAYAGMGGAIATVAAAADRTIGGELTALAELPAPEPARRALGRGRVIGALAAAGRHGAIAAAGSGDADRALAWLTLREYRRATRVSLVRSAASDAVRRMAGGELAAEAASAIVRDDLDDTYHARLQYAAAGAVEAAERSLSVRAAESAGLITSYLTILGEDYSAKMGAAARAELDSAVQRLTAAALADDFGGVHAAASAVLDLWRGYQAVELPAEELARRANLVQLFLDLTAIEYRDGGTRRQDHHRP